MSQNLSVGDVLVEKSLRTDTLYKVEEAAPPYPVTARPYGKNSHMTVDIPEVAVEQDYIVGSPQSVTEKVLEVGGFRHEHPACPAGVIVQPDEVARAYAEIASKVGYEVFKDILLPSRDTVLSDAKTAADILKVFYDTYKAREELSFTWFENIELNELGSPVCKECGNLILDETF